MSRGRLSRWDLPGHTIGDHGRCNPARCIAAREARLQTLVGQGLTTRQLSQRLGVGLGVIQADLRRGRREGWL